MNIHCPTISKVTLAPLFVLAALGLPGCSPEPEERTFETRTDDKSGGELIVRDADEPGIGVELPRTEMTPVAPDTPRPVDDVDMMQDGQ